MFYNIILTGMIQKWTIDSNKMRQDEAYFKNLTNQTADIRLFWSYTSRWFSKILSWFFRDQ